MSQLACPIHPDADLIEDHHAGDVICPECGLVVGDRIVDVGTEWRSFSNEASGNDPSRVGAPEMSLAGWADLSTSFLVGSGASRSTQSLATAQRRNKTNKDRQITQAIASIREMAEHINLARPIQDSAAKLFKANLDNKALTGRKYDAQVAACLYGACRKEGVPRTLNEIVAVSRVPREDIAKCFKILRKLDPSIKGSCSSDFMSRFCANLDLPTKIQTNATHIAQKAAELNIVDGRSPVTVAAAAIYMASQASETKKTAKEVSDVAGVSENTIKQIYKLLLPKAKELFPDNFDVKRLPSTQKTLSSH